MNKVQIYSLIAFISFFAAYATPAFSGVIRIPLHTCSKPAADLMDEKKMLLKIGDIVGSYGKYVGHSYAPTGQGEFCQGVDKLSPVENKYWQDKSFDAIDKNLHAQMPSQDETILFDDYMGAVRELGIFSIYIRPAKNQNLRYGLTLGLQVHSSLLKSALLRKVGFYQMSPKYLHRVRLKFSSLVQMNDFIEKAFCLKGPSEKAKNCLSIDETKRGFVTEKNDQDFSLVLHGIYLEKIHPEVPSLFDGLTPATADDIPYAAQYRTFRALAAPFVMGDVGESINRFGAQAVKVSAGVAEMNFAKSVYFDGFTNHDDMKWILNRYARLDKKDWDDIVDAGAYPTCTVPLVKSLLLHRYRSLLQVYFGKSFAKNAIDSKGLEIVPIENIQTSCVSEGKVSSETIPGYPQRFSHGPRTSPFETSDLVKYFEIATQSAVLQTALDKMSSKLVKVEILKSNPLGVEVGPEGINLLMDTTGVFAGVNFSANRMISTGTFYGSQAPIQMIDSVSISGSLGVQNIFDGLNGVQRNTGGRFSYMRTFTHVVPLEGVKTTDQGEKVVAKPLDDAKKAPWKHLLLVDSRLKELAAPLKDGSLTPFLKNLKVGEVFTITDSIVAGGTIGWNSGLDALFGFVRGLSVGLSFDATRQTVLRQIQINRLKTGFQIFVRDIDSHMLDENGNAKPNHKQTTDVYGLTFDYNYWINLFKIRAQRMVADLHTDAFVINYSADVATQATKAKVDDQNVQAKLDEMLKLGGRTASALRAIIFESNVEPLYAYHRGQQFEIDHGLKINEVLGKFLWNRFSSLNQHQEISFLRTGIPKEVDGAPVENKKRTIVLDRKGELKGRDFFGLGLDAFNAFLGYRLKDKAPQYADAGSNPSMVPFGMASWRTARTDSEITPDLGEDRWPTVSIIEHTWSGWSLNRKEMDSILNGLRENVKNVNETIADFPLIPEGFLGTVKKVDFFKVNSHLAVLPEAIDQIKNLILAPEAKDTPVAKADFFSRIFQELTQIGKKNKARGQDMGLYNNMMRLIGDGDENVGKQKYMMECTKMKMSDASQSQNTYAWYKGTGYECLAPWLEKLIKLSRTFPENDIKKQNSWMTEVIYVLDEQIPMSSLLNFLGKDKFIYYVEVVGFRVGDEDGDEGYAISNIFGEPTKPSPYADGLISRLADITKITPTEFMKTGSGGY